MPRRMSMVRPSPWTAVCPHRIPSSSSRIGSPMNPINASIVAGTMALTAASTQAGAAVFGAANPFYSPSTLPFHAPPFDRIKDEDYLPAIEAGMACLAAEMERIADNPAPPTFDNAFVAMEKRGRLLHGARAAFPPVSQANACPTLQSEQ